MCDLRKEDGSPMSRSDPGFSAGPRTGGDGASDVTSQSVRQMTLGAPGKHHLERPTHPAAIFRPEVSVLISGHPL